MNIYLAKRLAAHPRFEWMPGMRAVEENHAYRLLGGYEMAAEDTGIEFGLHGCGDLDCCTMDKPTGLVPDLDDPATQGCLLAMLFATGATWWEIDTDDHGGWYLFEGCIQDTRIAHPTIGHAAAEALLALWGEG
jgi:hypothetical protein